MKAVLYCRVSSDLQRESGSIQSQVAYARQYCQLHSITILETYLDDGVSGTIKVSERPAGARLLKDARAEKFDTVLVFRIDRLARRTSDLLNTLELLEESNVAIRSMTEPFDTSNATGKFMTSMLGSIAELERANIAERSKSGSERVVREGRWTGGRPLFGYRISAGRRLAIDPEQSEIVKNIFTWYLSGQRVRGITARLNAAEVKHPMDWNKPVSRPWYEATVSTLLHNRSYIGEWEYRKRTDRRKVHGKTTFTVTTPDQRIAVSIPAIVSVEDFQRVQVTMRENEVFSKRNVKHFYLLRGLIFCGHCGRRYVGLASGSKQRIKHYYRCASHVSPGGNAPCEGKAIRADLLDAAVWEQCVGFISHPESVFDELRETMQRRQFSQHDLKSEVAQMDAALQVKTKERARVINLIRRSVISDNEGERELTTLQLEADQLERQRAELLSSLAAAESAELKALTAETMLGLLADKITASDDNTRREIACVLVDQIMIEKKDNRALAKACYVLRSSPPSSKAVDCVEVGLPYPTQLTVNRSLYF